MNISNLSKASRHFMLLVFRDANKFVSFFDSIINLTFTFFSNYTTLRMYDKFLIHFIHDDMDGCMKEDHNVLITHYLKAVYL